MEYNQGCCIHSNYEIKSFPYHKIEQSLQRARSIVKEIFFREMFLEKELILEDLIKERRTYIVLNNLL